jgi:hypothetical protein
MVVAPSRAPRVEFVCRAHPATPGPRQIRFAINNRMRSLGTVDKTSDGRDCLSHGDHGWQAAQASSQSRRQAAVSDPGLSGQGRAVAALVVLSFQAGRVLNVV